MSVRYSYIQPDTPLPLYGRRDGRPRGEDLDARERRIFGGLNHDDQGFDDYGLDGEDDDAEMKKGMLDVVLGLFDGLDYDDEDFGFISGKV